MSGHQQMLSKQAHKGNHQQTIQYVWNHQGKQMFLTHVGFRFCIRRCMSDHLVDYKQTFH
jgi:hypothetical protein